MPDMLIHKANELKPQTRKAIEAEFGRALRDDEEISIAARASEGAPAPSSASAFDSPAESAHSAALRRLEAHYARMDEKTADIPEEEIEQILLEAIRSVRPIYQERR